LTVIFVIIVPFKREMGLQTSSGDGGMVDDAVMLRERESRMVVFVPFIFL